MQLSSSNFKLKMFQKDHSYENLQKAKFERHWGELEEKTVSRNNHRKYMTQTFHTESRNTRKFYFYFSAVFCQ